MHSRMGLHMIIRRFLPRPQSGASRLVPTELLRFALVSGLCAGIDVGLGLVAIILWNPTTYIAAFFGWCAGVVSGYLVHHFWTFPSRDKPRPSSTFWLYSANCIIILALRYCIIWIMELLSVPPAGTLLIAVTGSFTLNYFISRTYIFR